MLPSRRLITAIPLAALAACGAESSGRDGDLQIAPLYDQSSGHIVLDLSRPLGGDERLLARARRGSFGKLDCASADASFSAVADTGELQLTGPAVDAALTQPFYGPEWAHEPTPEMLAALEKGTDSIIDVCYFDGQRLVASLEVDLFQSWDKARTRLATVVAKDGPETRINSAQEYGVRCVGELGEIPFFQKTGEGAYTTFNCLDATPVPMTVTDARGNVTSPDRVVSKCDKPQYIYSSCEGGPRVATRVNEEGTRWTLLCRKSIGGSTSSQYNDIAMIGHNPFTGKTCFFQNALYEKKNGAAIPHPADVTKSTNLWSGVHGGLGSGIQCADCHDSDAFIHTPWIDGAKDAQGRTIVPKFGEDQDMPLGANDAPYSIVNLQGQGWTMHKQITSPEVNACARCHRMAGGKWLAWAKRLDGTDSAFRGKTTPAYLTFEKLHWMPPDLTGLTQSAWATSEFGKALDFLKRCATNRALCTFADIPTTRPGGGDGTVLHNRLPDMSDRDVAMQASALLGVGVPGSQSRCGECHSLTQDGLRTWQTLSESATTGCLAETAPGTPVTQVVVADQAIPRQQVLQYGPFDVPVGGIFEARMSGTEDADLYVKRGAPATTNSYDCASTSGTSVELCGPQQFAAAGPGQFYVAVLGYAETSTFTLEVAITPPGEARPAADIVSCLRLDPTSPSSPFSPQKLGVFTAAAHLGWFQKIFQAAYPLGAPGNTANTWLTQYLKFRQRVGMPKGNHPKFTQGELDIVAEWFARKLPLLDEAVPVDPPPSTCTPTISADLTAHVGQMQTAGWTAVNRDRGMTMFGCAGATDPRQCLTTLPAAASKPYGGGWASLPGSQIRVLRELSFISYYWMRSSADGRFVANGNSSPERTANGMISDLQADRDIPTEAMYDPGFFPDNSGFVFQGTPIGTGFCSQNLLTSNPQAINFSEAQCSQAANIGLYQHMGRALGGGDYFVVNGQFVSDEGGHPLDLEDPIAGFARETQAILTPLTFNGTHYVAKTPVPVETPFEGDTILSPSSTLMVSRLAGPFNRQLGFVVRKVNAVANGNGYSITAPEVARYCVRGAKPAISFDERFMVYHHYVEENDWAELGFASATDPTFVEYRTKGAANLYVLDMTTGVTRRVTMMQPGQYALFPHFRSDGWIYAMVRDANTGKEYAIASDAMLVLD